MAAVLQSRILPPTPSDTLLAIGTVPPSLPSPLSTSPVSDEHSGLRVSFPRRPLPTPPTASYKQPKQPAAAPAHVPPPVTSSPSRPTVRSTFYSHMPSTGLATISAKPEIIARLLDHLSWTDFHGLSSASRSLRRVFLDPKIKDVVFGHFVPGYQRALALRDKRIWEDTIRMDYADLGLLMLSLETPLHRYPMHAISVLASNSPTVEQFTTTKHLQSLSQIHSRAVLFLQNMVHSTTQPVPSELDDPRWKASALSPSSSMRELTFPAPLSYFDPQSSSGDRRNSQSRSPSEDTRTPSSSEEARNSESSSPSRRSASKLRSQKAKFDLKPIAFSTSRRQKQSHGRKWGSESSASNAYAANSFGVGGRTRTAPGVVAAGFATRSASAGPSSWRPAAEPQPTTLQRRGKRLSIFGAPSPLPPPAPEPASMRIYSGSWRRTTRSTQVLPPAQATASDDEAILKPPNRRFLGSSNLSSQSSLNSSPTQSSRGGGSGSGGGQNTATPSSSSPLDLIAATSRTRAPILRVFVPCASLSEDVIAECEDQLIEDGLWEHLSAGDVVCNFGYVPPIEEAEEQQQQGPEKDHRRWLVYNGEQLLVYAPHQAPPVPDPLSLPSPFYYTHILPPQLNPRLRLRLPPLRASYTLAPLTNTIAITASSSSPSLSLAPSSPAVSPNTSPRLGMGALAGTGAGGLVRVRTYAWLATLDAHQLDARLVEEGWLMHEGWAGEWVLQGEGTREGRVALQEELMRRTVSADGNGGGGGGGDGNAGMEREYEIVLDKSGSGRLWLRMVDSTPRAHHYASTDNDSNMNSLHPRRSP